MLKVRNAGIKRGQQWVFRHINFDLQPGQILGIYGESGCGKSTFCQSLTGLLPLEEGSITLNEKTIPSKEYRPIQLVYQHPERAVNPSWRLRQILTEGYIPDHSLLEALQIEDEWLTRWPSELSGGQLQRICIARALAPHTQYLLADEMTSMLDSITQAYIWRSVIGIVRERQMGLLIISHDKQLLSNLCDETFQFSTLCQSNGSN